MNENNSCGTQIPEINPFKYNKAQQNGTGEDKDHQRGIHVETLREVAVGNTAPAAPVEAASFAFNIQTVI